MRILIYIAFLLTFSSGFSQKITLTIKKDTTPLIDSVNIDGKYNGFYATEYEQAVVDVNGNFITLRVRCFMEVKYDTCWVLQENISTKTARKLYRKGGLFESKNTLVGCFKLIPVEEISKYDSRVGNDTKRVYYLNLFQQEFGKFYRSTSIENSDNYKVFFSQRVNDKRPLIGMPVHVKSVRNSLSPNGIYTSIYFTFVKL